MDDSGWVQLEVTRAMIFGRDRAASSAFRSQGMS